MKEYTSIRSNADQHMRRPSNSGLSLGDDFPDTKARDEAGNPRPMSSYGWNTSVLTLRAGMLYLKELAFTAAIGLPCLGAAAVEVSVYTSAAVNCAGWVSVMPANCDVVSLLMATTTMLVGSCEETLA